MAGILPVLKVLKDPKTRNEFEEYCKKSYCAETVMFWEAIQEYKTTEDNLVLPIRAQSIYEKFIKPASPFHVNLANEDVKVIEKILESQEEQQTCEKSLFNTAESTVLLLMEPLIPKYIQSTQSPLSPSREPTEDVEIQVVSAWNHSSLPASGSLSKKLEKELERIDFQKHHVGMDALRVEEENKHLDNWCNLLERETTVNRTQIERMQKAIEKLNAEKEYLKEREEKLIYYLTTARSSLDAIVDETK